VSVGKINLVSHWPLNSPLDTHLTSNHFCWNASCTHNSHLTTAVASQSLDVSYAFWTRPIRCSCMRAKKVACKFVKKAAKKLLETLVKTSDDFLMPHLFVNTLTPHSLGYSETLGQRAFNCTAKLHNFGFQRPSLIKTLGFDTKPLCWLSCPLDLMQKHSEKLS